MFCVRAHNGSSLLEAFFIIPACSQETERWCVFGLAKITSLNYLRQVGGSCKSAITNLIGHRRCSPASPHGRALFTAERLARPN